MMSPNPIQPTRFEEKSGGDAPVCAMAAETSAMQAEPVKMLPASSVVLIENVYIAPLLGSFPPIDVFAQLDAFVANEHSRPGNQLAQFVLALAAERAVDRSLRITGA